MASLDITTLPLKLLLKGTSHKFFIFPGGPSPCPRSFANILKPSPAELRKWKRDVFVYINDQYLQGSTGEKLIQNIIDSISHLR